jgi:hypothetical protein
MTLSARRDEKLDQPMTFQPRPAYPAKVLRRSLLAASIVSSSLVLGCSDATRGTNANSSGGPTQPPGVNANANPGSRATGGQSTTLDIKEPERYSVAMTISTQDGAAEEPARMLTLQLSLAKLGADRLWTFEFPAPLGQAAYLEKSGLKYLVLIARKQYAEISPAAIGFSPGDVLMPHSIAERLKSGKYEKLGLEPVNGRTAIKYRITAVNGASNQTDGVIFVDQETGLPLRSELNVSRTTGAKSRVIVEARDVQLNPDRAQFDVPVGMKKVSPQEARLSIEGFASAIRTFADAINGTQSEPAGNASQSAANKNASRQR